MTNPHILMVPFPAQGHVTPLMEFSQILINHGIKVTFVVPEDSYQKIIKAIGNKKGGIDARIRLVSISLPEAAKENRFLTNIVNFLEATYEFMPGALKRIIEEINESDEDDITCVVSDLTSTVALEAAAEQGIKAAGLCPASALLLLSTFNIPMMVDQGIIDDETGFPIKLGSIQMSTETPSVNPSHFSWIGLCDISNQKSMFKLIKRNLRNLEKAEWMLSNSAYDLEPGVFAALPKLLPIGPVSEYNGIGNWAASFWAEDDSCLKWLDHQPEASVVYVAFGSLVMVDQTQFEEMAMGLEHSNKRFLWVVRPDITEGEKDAYLEGFLERVADRGRLVDWAPQRAVLGHPAIACFVSHCGWNSTLEGISNGVPFLCWPHISDQLWNASYVYEYLKVGLGFVKDENGIINKEEIKNKIEKVMGDKDMKARALELKEKIQNCVKEDGSSNKNLKNFINWVKSE